MCLRANVLVCKCVVCVIVHAFEFGCLLFVCVVHVSVSVLVRVIGVCRLVCLNVVVGLCVCLCLWVCVIVF